MFPLWETRPRHIMILYNFFRKTLFCLILGIALIFSMSAPAMAAPILLRAQEDSEVFLVENGKKYWVRSADIFNSYSFKWPDIKETSANELAEYPFATLVAKPGDPKIYYIGKSGKEKRWIASLEAFRANNFDWREIKTINDLDLKQYPDGADITGDLINEKTVSVEVSAPTTLGGDPNMPRGVDFGILWNVWKSVESKYRDLGKLDTQKMVYGATEGVVKSLGDPYSVFLEPKEAKKFGEDIAGEFGGIGAELGYKNGIVIIAPLKNMPAERVGLRAGDRILEINGTSTLDMTLEDAVSNIRGEKSTTVRLLISREGSPDTIEFKIVRETIKVPTLEWSKKTGDIAYLKIHNFFGAIEDDFVKAENEMKTAGIKKIILDMRNNPGGLLGAAINISGEFVPKDKLIVSQDFGPGKDSNDFRSQGGNLVGMPVVVLINEGSASASEIVAGALKDSAGAKLIGAKTFGKGSVQEVLQLANGSSLKITVASWIRPSGKSIDKEGIEPDIAVEITDADRSANRDPQLDKALSVLQGM